jgi:penicillin-binding protein 1A
MNELYGTAVMDIDQENTEPNKGRGAAGRVGEWEVVSGSAGGSRAPRRRGPRIDLKREFRAPGRRGGAYFGAFVVVALLALLAYWTVLIYELPSVRELEEARYAEASIVYTTGGDELTRYHDKNRTWVELSEISEPVVHALVATEDHRFYSHWGVDIRRTISSVYHTVRGDPQGGSTITMQYARNAFEGMQDDATVTRKIKEWLTARRIERKYEKNEILEMYLNTVPFLYNAFGIEAGARTYFSKPASELDVAEAAVLIGMLRGTVLYNPVKNPENALERRNVVLGLMNKHGFLTDQEYQQTRERDIDLAFVPSVRDENLAPYFAEHLRLFLGEWADNRGYNLYTDGLRIHTTIDTELQAAAEDAVASRARDLQSVADREWGSSRWENHTQLVESFIRQTPEYREALAEGLSKEEAIRQLREDDEVMERVYEAGRTVQAGFVAIDPRSGHVKAWVGGRDFSRFQYDHVAQARRQPGSTFKPFVFAAALENGYSPEVQLVDQRIEFRDPTSRRTWRPGNAGDTYTEAPMSLRDALAYSKNTIAAQLTVDLGPARVKEYARKMGIRSELQEVMSIGLGVNPVSLYELTAAYGTIANGGQYVEPIFVTRIEDRRGRTIATFSNEARRAISPNTAYTLIDMMRGTIDYGTGVAFRGHGGRGDIAGKTGTSQNNADGWFIAMHPELVIGSWVGFTSPQMRFRGNLGQGSQSALPLVANFTSRAGLNGEARFQPPPGYSLPQPTRERMLFTFQDGRLEYDIPDYGYSFEFEEDEYAWDDQIGDDVVEFDITDEVTTGQEGATEGEQREGTRAEPDTEYDERTRESRERSGVRDALERLRQQLGNDN